MRRLTVSFLVFFHFTMFDSFVSLLKAKFVIPATRGHFIKVVAGST